MDRWLKAAFLFSMVVVAQAVRAAAPLPCAACGSFGRWANLIWRASARTAS